MKRLSLLTLLALAGGFIADHQPVTAEDAVLRWLSFDDADSPLPEAEHCEVARSTDAREGDGCLSITTPDPMEEVASVTFKLPPDTGPTRALVAQVRTAPTRGPVAMRWHACDDDGNTLRQRMFEFDHGPMWTRMEFPLALWRWGADRAGRWDEVRSIKLTIESHVSEVRLDEMHFERGGSALPSAQWYEALAFKDRGVRTFVGDAYRISTDARDDYTADDLSAVHDRFAPITDWTRRVFDGAVRPMRDDEHVLLLVFNDADDYGRFFLRLATAWRVPGTVPSASSYAVQDIAACTHDPEAGLDRAVFFHEAVRATMARMLRIIPGSPGHLWFQQAVANYLQLCLYPEALRLGVFAAMFENEPGDQAYFRTLEDLITGEVTARNYAQLASLMAYFVEERPGWPARIARGVADGRELTAILDDLDTSLDDVEEAWLKWGRERFKPDDKHHFEMPEEWADDE